jgi:hypothetical protein
LQHFQEKWIRFSVRKCDYAKMLEWFPFPVELKPLQRANGEQSGRTRQTRFGPRAKPYDLAAAKLPKISGW